MNKLILEFNPDMMRVADVKLAVTLLRDLISKRADLELRNVPVADMFLASFDTMTQNVEST